MLSAKQSRCVYPKNNTSIVVRLFLAGVRQILKQVIVFRVDIYSYITNNIGGCRHTLHTSFTYLVEYILLVKLMIQYLI